MRNLADLLVEKTRENPAAEYFRYRREDAISSLSRAETARRAALWADALARHGVRPGDRVAIVSEKSVAHAVSFFAVFSCGAVAVPVAEELPEAEMRFIFSDADPALILASDAYLAKAGAAAGGVPVLALGALPSEGAAELAPGPAAPGDVACVIYTSGSMGRPKGVMLTHRNFLANSASSVELIGAAGGDVVLSVLPYWHSFALTVELFTLLLAGGVIAIPKDKRDFTRHMGEYRPTIVLLVPRIAAMLRQGIADQVAAGPAWKRRLFARALANAARVCRADPGLCGTPWARLMRRLYLRTVLGPLRARLGGAFRFFVSGGAPLDPECQTHFTHLGIPIYQGYGLTESSPVVSAGNAVVHRLGSSGAIASWLLPGGGGDFTFEDDAGRRGKDLRGELLLRGDCVMAGYRRREEETAAALRDGWLRTGDVGYVDGDGYLYLAGRRTNLTCLVGGEKFHPEPIEERLKSAAMIADCVVFGEGCKNAYALVVPSAEESDGMPREDVVRRIRGEIARLLADSPAHWRPRDFALIPPLSIEDGLLTSTMKVRRARVLAHHEETIRELCARNGDRAPASNRTAPR